MFHTFKYSQNRMARDSYNVDKSCNCEVSLVSVMESQEPTKCTAPCKARMGLNKGVCILHEDILADKVPSNG